MFRGLAILWAILSALAWLVPNHYPPWANFHSDAWMAFVSLAIAMPIVFQYHRIQRWHLPALLVLILIFVPWIQLFFGLLNFRGQAWLVSGYLLGLLLAILIGAAWEKKASEKFVDFVFLSISFAAIASVGLVMGSWFEVIPNGVNNFISMGYYGGRHYANIGQPNLLATLLLWGVLGGWWAYTRKNIGFGVALFYGVYLILGLVLTKSRTGYVAGSAVVLILIFSPHLRSKKLLGLAIFLSLAYIFFPFLINIFELYFFNNLTSGEYVRGIANGDIRLSAWRLFIGAAVSNPWVGYGWTEVSNAQINMADIYPSLGGVFGHAHNIILDLVIWLGIPAAFFVTSALLWWFWAAFLKLRSQEDVIVYLVLLVIAVHAMFEYPHQYANFLIPAGFFVGIVSERTSAIFVLKSSGGKVLLLWFFACFWLFVTVNEYLGIEKSYNILRYERAGLVYPYKDGLKVPDVFFLNQFPPFIEMARKRPQNNMSDEELILREKVTRVFPSPGAIFELAQAYALNGKYSEASYWLKRVCPLSNKDECEFFRDRWDKIRNQNNYFSKIDWPV